MTRRVSSEAFIGRSAELDELRAAFRDARGGRPTTVLVSGESGIGKSRLLGDFAAWTRDEGALVLHGAGLGDAVGGHPYAPFVEALRGLRRERGPAVIARLVGAGASELSRLVPGIDATHDVEGSDPVDAGRGPDAAGRAGQARLFDEVLALVVGLAAEQPLVLVLEDLDRADVVTRELVAFLAQSLRREPVLVVGSYRTGDVVTDRSLLRFVAGLERSRNVVRVALERFRPSEVAAQLQGILGTAPDPRLAAEIASRSDGNPFFVEELLAASLSGERADLPPNLHELLTSRLDVLDPPTLSTVRAIAVAGSRATDDLIAMAAGLDEDQLYRALREAIADGILVAPGRDNGVYRLRHTLLSEAVVADMLPGERRRLHASVAAALANRPPSQEADAGALVADLALHWEAADRPREALASAVAAGRARSEVYAFAGAAEHYERALRHWDSVPDAEAAAGLDRLELLERSARASFLAGDLGRAVELANRAVESADPGADPVRAGLLYQALGSYRSSAGDDAAAVAALEEAVRLVPSEPPTGARARVLASLGAQLMLLGRHADSIVRCEEALAISRTLGIAELESQALNFLGVDLVNLGAVDEGLDRSREALEVARRGVPPIALLEAYNNLAFMLDRADRLAEALSVAEDGVRAAHRLGLDRLTGGILRATTGAVLFRLGRWDEAATIISATLEEQPQGELAISLRRDRGRLRVARGELDAGDADLQAARQLAVRARRADSIPALAEALAELAHWRGKPDEAMAAVADGLAAVAETDAALALPALCASGIRAQADRAAIARAGRLAAEEAEAISAGGELLRRVVELVGDDVRAAAKAPSHIAWRDMAEGEHGRLRGATDTGPWRAAAERWETLGMPYPAAYARFRLAEAVLAGRGARADAAAALAAASETATTLGAQPLGDRITRLAKLARIDLAGAGGERARGERGERSGAARRLGLTPRELEVLGLVAAGRTNRQIAETLFIAEKTVGIHMTNLLGKLEVSNRSEAAAVAERLRLLDGSRPAGSAAMGERLVRTFMFTDIVRSTGLLEAIGDDAWGDLRRWHDTTIRRIVAQAGGEEIDHAGDGFFVAFVDPSTAVECAAEIQRTLAAHRRSHGFAPTVRIGLHTAEATRSSDGWSGKGVHEAARIGSLAIGGQIVASESTVDHASPAIRSRAREPRLEPLRGLAAPVTILTIDWQQVY